MTSRPGSPGWKPLTELDDEHRPRGRLLGALLTTFDPPDPAVLLEDYLPAWLGLEHPYADEGADRVRYFAELVDALRRLHGRFTIISSAGEAPPSPQAWLWNHVDRHEVGRLGRAVQHAKLWMFHRAPSPNEALESLELVVSSANLTGDGLRGQIQGGWRCVHYFERDKSRSYLDSWGILPSFLRELGESAGGSCASKKMDHWVDLLRRCKCPDGVAFIASAPGSYPAATLARRNSAWGAAGIRNIWKKPWIPKLTAMVPTIGRWTPDALCAWATIAGVDPDHISIAWVSGRHPWAHRWQLDPMTEAALVKCEVGWLEVPDPSDPDVEWESPLCEEHQQVDRRWSHAKLYEFLLGTRRRLLITSANLSRAAWGDPRHGGGLAIENFELGVVVDVDESFADWLDEGSDERSTSEVDFTEPQEQPVAWMAAEWNGTKLTVECRTTPGAALKPNIQVTTAKAKSVACAIDWTAGQVTTTRLEWSPEAGVPVLVGVGTEDGFERHVAVQDVRPTSDRQLLCGEFEEAVLRDTLYQLLEARYGYVSPTESIDLRGSGQTYGITSSADYSVPAYVDARRRFHLIDSWWKKLNADGEHQKQFTLSDGQLILERWQQEAQPQPDVTVATDGDGEAMPSGHTPNQQLDPGIRLAARVAAEELALRIERHK